MNILKDRLYYTVMVSHGKWKRIADENFHPTSTCISWRERYKDRKKEMQGCRNLIGTCPIRRYFGLNSSSRLLSTQLYSSVKWSKYRLRVKLNKSLLKMKKYYVSVRRRTCDRTKLHEIFLYVKCTSNVKLRNFKGNTSS